MNDTERDHCGLFISPSPFWSACRPCPSKGYAGSFPSSPHAGGAVIVLRGYGQRKPRPRGGRSVAGLSCAALSVPVGRHIGNNLRPVALNR